MSVKEQIEKETISAAKNRDAVRLSTLRMIKAAIHNKEIDLRRELNDGEVFQVLGSLVKQRKDAIEQFEKGGRNDLADKERQELSIIQSFMPAQMSEAELREAIEKAILDTGAKGPKDMGKVMKVLMPVVSGRVDGKTVSEMVKAMLTT
ncbi:MAG: GatB/YqeY domain-containing protein [Syntrophales bacterium]|nr:GatB/YqeY domain-containing protein [Syntrophales bacterium]